MKILRLETLEDWLRLVFNISIVGGKPDNARGGGKDSSKLGEALEKAKSLIG
jgi:hypothetical protein